MAIQDFEEVSVVYVFVCLQVKGWPGYSVSGLCCSCTEGEEVSSLRVAIQDLENQIEEQKHKISNTPMALLRVSIVCGMTQPMHHYKLTPNFRLKVGEVNGCLSTMNVCIENLWPQYPISVSRFPA